MRKKRRSAVWQFLPGPQQIAEAAKNQGDAPDIVKDDVTKVTLFDYSDIVADENPLSGEEE